MKWIVLTVLLCAVTLGAAEYNNGLGLGHSLGLGHGLGSMSNSHSEHVHKNGFGGQEYDSGASGVDNHEYHDVGASSHHDRGHHHSKVTTINKAEDSEEHDIGSSNVFDTGAQSNADYDNYQKGASGYGNEYDAGVQDQEVIFD